MKSEISVIIPIYNAEKFIIKCLDSVINQTFQDIEIICIDDCSTDNSKQILKDFASKDSRIKTIFFDKNKKQGGARNAGLDIAQGKYVTFVDADDYIEPTMLEKMYKAAERNYCDLVIANIKNVALDENSNNLKDKIDIYYDSKKKNSGFYVFDFFTSDLRVGPVAKLYKKDIIDTYNIRFPEKLIQEDEAFYWYYMPFASNIYNINEDVYYRQIHQKSTMYQLNYYQQGIYDQISILKQIQKFLKKHKLYKLYKSKFIEYTEMKLNSIEDKEVYNKYFNKIILFLPEIVQIIFTELKFINQIYANRNKKIVFWGASIFLSNCLEKYKIKSKNIIGIIDKNSKKQGEKIQNYQIFTPEALKELNPDVAIFAVKNNAHNIYPKIEVFLQKEYPNIYLSKNIFPPKITCKPDIPQKHLERFSVHLVEHCNLNCKGCNNFSPLAEKKFANLESYENDIKRIAELTNKKLKRINLIGGEPLLHPNLIEFLRVSREHLPNTRLIILTNGILLPTLGEDFWNACNKYNIAIEVTKYPIKVDFDKIEEIAKRYDVEYGYFCNTGTVTKTSNSYPIDVNGKQDMVSSFKSCECANNCIFLKDGRLYTCAIASNIEHFNKHFGYNVPLTEKDSIDIYKAKDEKQIMKFLAKPIPFCKYCNVKDRVYGIDWTVSKKEIKEWI